LSNPMTAFEANLLPSVEMEDANADQLMSRKHRQYRVDNKFVGHPVHHMVSEYFAGYDIPDHIVIHEPSSVLGYVISLVKLIRGTIGNS
jgi:hypothetical protein